MNEGYELDLTILIPDNDIEQSIRGLLSRSDDLGIRDINFNIIKHHNRDPGCFKTGHDLLRLFHNRSQFALNIFDYEGCGGESKKSPEEIEEEARVLLSRNGWQGRAESVVIVPEIEQWLWPPNKTLERVTGWYQLTPTLREWLQNHGFYSSAQQTKPDEPKEAFEACLRQSGKRLSASLFHQIALEVNFERCEDRAFNKFREILQKWFPREE